VGEPYQFTVAADYPFGVDTVTVSTPGQGGLTVLARNLWPQDCQTCGWALGADKPSVIVPDLIASASASLLHTRCRSPQWITDMPTGAHHSGRHARP